MTQYILTELTEDISMKSFSFKNLPELKVLKEEYIKAKTEICIERAKHITEYMKKSDGLGEPMIIRRAKAVSNYLSKRKIFFHDNNPIAGASTSKKLGAPVYPEQLGLSIWPELETISDRGTNKQLISDTDAETLNFDIFPYWMDRTILEITRKRLTDSNSKTLFGLQLMEKIAFFTAGKCVTISHTTPYYEKVLSKGLKAMIAEAKQKEDELGDCANDKDKLSKKHFYRAMQISMEGINNYANRIAVTASKLAISATGKSKTHYEQIAEICSRVPASPARSFREAINSFWICHVAILAENVNMAFNPGRLDQLLFPYFEKDIKDRNLTTEEALTLIGALWLKISDNTNLVPESAEKMFGGAGTVPAVTLGGITKDNKDAVNDLTYLMLRITELLAIKDPNVNARYHNELNTKEYRNRVAEVILNTKAIPAFFNDKTNIGTLVNQGVSLEHARDYAIVGCVEIGSAGREFMSSSSILMNLAAAFDMTLYNGKRPYISGDLQIGPQTGAVEGFKTYEDFKISFYKQLKYLIDVSIELNNELGKTHQEWLPEPLLSCFFEGPLEKGKDLLYGGALYNSSGATHIAFADVCDSLIAIEDTVFINNKISLSELKEALERNFDSYDNIHNYIKNIVPKYGMDDSANDKPIAVKTSKDLIKFIFDSYQEKISYRGGKYRPAFWTMTNHAGYGTMNQALPSGRKAKEVFSSGITPASQCAKDLTGAYSSVAKLNNIYIPGCVALNMKYTPEPNTELEKSISDFSHYLEGYFNSDGMQVQFNIQTYQDLIKAKENPDEYPELLVRVSGYSAYFKDLNQAMQHELITRTQYNLETGKSVDLPY